MVLKVEKVRLKKLLCEAIALLCRSELSFLPVVNIEALIGITINEDEVLLVSFNESINTSTTSSTIINDLFPINGFSPEVENINNEQNVKRASKRSNSDAVNLIEDSLNSDCTVEFVKVENLVAKLDCQIIDDNYTKQRCSRVEQASHRECSNWSVSSDKHEAKSRVDDFNNHVPLLTKSTKSRINESALLTEVVSETGEIFEERATIRHSSRINRKFSAIDDSNNKFSSGIYQSDLLDKESDTTFVNKESNFTGHWDHDRIDTSVVHKNLMDNSLAEHRDIENDRSIFIKEEINDGELIAFQNSKVNNEVFAPLVKRRRKSHATPLSASFNPRTTELSESGPSEYADQIQRLMLDQMDAMSYDDVNTPYGHPAFGQMSADADCNTYQCQICSAQLSGRRTLYEHIRGTHLCVHVYECQYCGVAFKWRSGLKRHRVKCHMAPQ